MAAPTPQGMGKLGLAVSGIVLIGIFLALTLLKGTNAVRAWVDPNSLLVWRRRFRRQ